VISHNLTRFVVIFSLTYNFLKEKCICVLKLNWGQEAVINLPCCYYVFIAAKVAARSKTFWYGA